MNADQAMKVIIEPRITEKTFSMVDDEHKICFIVDRYANKGQIAEAIRILYKTEPLKINTARTMYGKKAYVQFESLDKAKDLATDIGML